MDLKTIVVFLSLVALYSAEEYDLDKIKAEGEALVRDRLEEFKSDAGKGKPLQPYVQGLKQFLGKEPKNEVAVDELTGPLMNYFNDLIKGEVSHPNMEYIRRMDDKLYYKCLVSQAILDSGLEWMSQRIDSAKLQQWEVLNGINTQLKEANHFMSAATKQVNLFNQTVNEMTNDNYKTKSTEAVDQLKQMFPLGIQVGNRVSQAIYWMNDIDTPHDRPHRFL